MQQMQPVLWTKGVLLTPQHLQTQDRFLEDQLRFRLAALVPYGWGVHRLQIDRAALAGGLLSVTRASAIFPDGLLYDAADTGDDDALPPPRRVDVGWNADRPTRDVYLAVAKRASDAQQIAGAGETRGTRYVVEVVKRRDETNGLAERDLQLARKNVRVVCEGESLEGMTALRIARVRRGPAGEYELDPAVVPPLVDVAASDVVVGMARRLTELLAAKGVALSADRRQRNQGLAEFGAADIARFWLLYTVNGAYPLVRHLAERRGGHPEALFAALLSLAGSLRTFAAAADDPLPEYDHEDPGRCFRELDDRVRHYLDAALPVSAVSLPLRLLRPSVYGTSLDDDRYLAAAQLYLAAAADVSHAELLRRVPQLVKVGATDTVDALVQRSLSGVPLSHAPVPAGAVPTRLEYTYFALDRSGPAWESVRRARTLAAFVPADLPNPRLELIVVLPQ
jgi:type VI secretion system protein ImpJ